MKTRAASIILGGLDERLPTYRPALGNVPRRPTHGWLKAVRTAVGLSQNSVARKMGVTRQAYAQFEASEKSGTISLASIERAAAAMDCEFVYFVVPRESVARTYGELARIHDPAYRHLQASEHSMALENQAVGDLPPRPKP
ncbi:MAG TPA: helix-turn-helix domain-containing protein [Lacunisphaera sp.]|nr:helix-turn-helix domain-containing protein [Lacunisphaera sp.]